MRMLCTFGYCDAMLVECYMEEVVKIIKGQNRAPSDGQVAGPRHSARTLARLRGEPLPEVRGIFNCLTHGMELRNKARVLDLEAKEIDRDWWRDYNAHTQACRDAAAGVRRYQGWFDKQYWENLHEEKTAEADAAWDVAYKVSWEQGDPFMFRGKLVQPNGEKVSGLELAIRVYKELFEFGTTCRYIREVVVCYSHSIRLFSLLNKLKTRKLLI